MVQCSNCGCQNSENALFCVKCKKKLAVSTQQKKTSPVSSQNIKSLNSKIIVVIVIVVVLVMICAVVFFIYNNRYKIFNDITEENISQVESEKNVNSEKLEEKTDSIQQDNNENVTNKEEQLNQKEDTQENNQYILPDSNSRYLTRFDLEGLTIDQCRIARNELYARYGRMFDDKGLQAYFNSCSWYQGTISAADFDETVFNEFEKANRDLIVQYENELRNR